MPAILKQVESIIVNGIVNNEIGINFSASQLVEENDKLKWTEDNPEKAEILFTLEDHELLYGQISIIGVGHIDYAARFLSLFSCDRKLADRALMSVGFYGQNSNRYTWRWQLGSAGNNDGWKDLFHKGANYGFEKTHDVLISLLSMSENFSNEILQTIINYFISKCEAESRFPWEYYYVKYDAFRPYCYGKYSTGSENQGPYMYYVMQTKSYWSPSTYMPFLKEADGSHISKEPNGLELRYQNAAVSSRNDCYVIKWTDKDPESIPISQKDGVDTEDRIVLLKNKIDEYGLR